MGHTLSRLLRPCKCLLKTQARSEPRTETTLPGQSEQAELASKLHRVHCYTGHTASLRRSTPTAHRRAPSAGAAFRREAAPAANTPFWRSRVSRRRSCCLCGSPAGSCPTWRYSTSQPCADSRRAAARGPPSSSPDRAVSCGPTTWPHAGAGRSVHSSVTIRSATLSAPACRRLQCAWAAPGEPQGGRLRAGSLCPRSQSCPRPAAAPRTAPPAPSPAQAGTPGLKHALRRRASRSPTRGDPGQRPWAQGDALESLVFMRGRIMHAHQPGHALQAQRRHGHRRLAPPLGGAARELRRQRVRADSAGRVRVLHGLVQLALQARLQRAARMRARQRRQQSPELRHLRAAQQREAPARRRASLNGDWVLLQQQRSEQRPSVPAHRRQTNESCVTHRMHTRARCTALRR